MVTQTQNKRIHIPNIHAFNWIRTHDPSIRASEGSSSLRPRDYSDRNLNYVRSILPSQNINIWFSYTPLIFRVRLGRSCYKWSFSIQILYNFVRSNTVPRRRLLTCSFQHVFVMNKKDLHTFHIVLLFNLMTVCSLVYMTKLLDCMGYIQPKKRTFLKDDVVRMCFVFRHFREPEGTEVPREEFASICRAPGR
jgi:hypothetical protein